MPLPDHRFFSPEHWEQIMLAAEGKRPSERAHLEARLLWLRGQRSLCYAAAVEELTRQANYMRVAALEFFQGALLLDPGMADAAAGLAVLALEDPIFGDSSDQLELLALVADRYGEEQRASGRGLVLTFSPLFGLVRPTLCADDCRVVHAMDLVARDDHEGARRWLARCNPDTASVLAFGAFLDIVEDDPGPALAKLSRLEEVDPEYLPDALFGQGMAYVDLKLWDAALTHFQRALASADMIAASEEGFALKCRYAVGAALEQLGETEAARVEFERVYAEDPTHADVAARLGREIPEGSAQKLTLDMQRFLDSLPTTDEPE